MKRNLIVTAITLLIGTAAFAQSEKRTEFFFQPGGSMHSIRGDYLFSSSTGEIDADGTRQDANEWSKKFQVAYEYGLTPDWALGVNLSMGQTDREVVNKGAGGQSELAGDNGLGDVVLFAHNTSPMGMWNLHYGLDINYSLGKAKKATRENEGTQQSGGYGARPYVGISYDTGMGMVGASLGYQWKDTRKVDVQEKNMDGKRKGGDIMDLNAFYEYHGDMWLADIRAGLLSNAEEKLTKTDSRTGNATDMKAEAFTSSYVAVAGQYFFAPTAMVRLGYRLDMVPDYKSDKDNNVNMLAYTNNTVDLAVRYDF